MRLHPLIALGAAAVLLLSGCAGTATTPASTVSADAVTGDLTIYAAASLKGAFEEISKEFATDNPGVTVEPIVYDGSSTLATQIIGGAPVDVFASADQANMKKVTDANLASDPQLFASNTLVIAVPKGNPGKVTGLADLASVTTVLCAPEVPCGAAAKTLLANEGVSVTPASLEQNVTAVLTKVRAGEADAGLVYATDAAAATDVEQIVPDGAADVVNHYPIVSLTDAANPAAAAAFTAFVLGDKGQAVLHKLGFGSS